jgi:hypothetical protein
MNLLATPARSSRQTKKVKGATRVGTRSSSSHGKRTPLKNRYSPLADLQETQKSSDEEEAVDAVVEKEVDRPLKSKKMGMSKWDFLQRMTAAGHPIIHDQEQLELTYRYIDLANSMLSQPIRRVEEMEDMQNAVDNEAEKTRSKDSPPFFRGNMATTIMVNGVDQIVRHRRAKGWSQALTDLFWEARVMVKDFWVVKKYNEEVVSVLVQMSSRYQKILAVGAVNMARGQVGEGLGRAQCRWGKCRVHTAGGSSLKKKARSRHTEYTITEAMSQSLRFDKKSMGGPAGGRGRPGMATARSAGRAVSGGWRGPRAERRLGGRLRRESRRLALTGSRRRRAETATRKDVRWRRTAMTATKQLSV